MGGKRNVAAPIVTASPEDDAEFAGYPAAVRQGVRRWLRILGRVATGTGPTSHRMKREARRARVSFGSVRAKWYAFTAPGSPGWRVLINRSRAAAGGRRTGSAGGVHPELAAYCQGLCVNNADRRSKNKGAWCIMVAQWRAGAKLPGLDSWREVDSTRRPGPDALPAGLSYRNFLRHAAPPESMLIAAGKRPRRPRPAAADDGFRLLAHSTPTGGVRFARKSLPAERVELRMSMGPKGKFCMEMRPLPRAAKSAKKSPAREPQKVPAK